MDHIRSTRNPAVVEAGRLHRAKDRRSSGRTLIEGPNLLREALAAGLEPVRTFALEADPFRAQWPETVLVAEAVMVKLAGTDNPRGPVAVIDIPDWAPPPPDRHLLVLWGVSDPGNVGTIIRSAAAFGLGVVTGPGTADIWSPKVLRAGAGAHFHTPLSQVAGLDELIDHQPVATVVDGGVAPRDLPRGRWAFLIGSEAHGLDADVIGRSEFQLTIPVVRDAESLNAAVAASIIAYEAGTGSGGSGPHG